MSIFKTVTVLVGALAGVLAGILVAPIYQQSIAAELPRQMSNQVPNNASSQSEADLLAFPGALGFGAGTSGGRYGDIRYVSTLLDDGEGSLREAVQGDDPKIVVFSVGGTIRLKSNLLVGENTTIAGQTAPGGITLLNTELDPTASKEESGRVEIQSNTIIRHIRVRGSSFANDAIVAQGKTRNVILDHISVSWAGDETIAFVDDTQNLTIQWSTLEAPLANWHGKLFHNYGAKLTGDNNGNISYYYNLQTHARTRAPSLNFKSGLVADVRGNVNYNCASGFKVEHTVDPDFKLGENQLAGRYNLIGNYYRKGPETTRYFGSRTSALLFLTYPIGIYVSEFYDDSRDNLVDAAVFKIRGNEMLSLQEKPYPVPFPTPPDDLKAEDAFVKVIAYAGAWPRDTVTVRNVEDVVSREGHWRVSGHNSKISELSDLTPITTEISSQTKISMALDSDLDGMPDAWEVARSLNRYENDSAGIRLENDGYTNIEVYLNSLAESLVEKE